MKTHANPLQINQVYKKLEECYDTSTNSYRSSETDASIAKEIGVSPNTVSNIRREYFGNIRPFTRDFDIVALEVRIIRIEKELGLTE